MGALSDIFKWGPRPMHLMVVNLRIIYAILGVGSSAMFAHITQDGAPSKYVHFVCLAYGRGDPDYRE